jgi:hypothetical protein
MALSQQQPVVPGVLDQPASGLDQPLLQAEKTEFPGFGFSRYGSTGAWRSQEMAPGKNLHFGGSKVGGWVYHNWKLGAIMEIPDKNLLLQRGSHIPKS